MINRCAVLLSKRLACKCPACASYGFGEESPVMGARCEACGLSTNALKAKITRCDVCGFSKHQELVHSVPASRCNYCNP